MGRNPRGWIISHTFLARVAGEIEKRKKQLISVCSLKYNNNRVLGFLGEGRMLFIFAIICFYIYWKKINSEREGVALAALVGMVGVLVIEMLMIWKEVAPFFAYSSFGG